MISCLPEPILLGGAAAGHGVSSIRDLPAFGEAAVCREALFGTFWMQIRVVRAEGFEPSQALRPNGFSYHLRLSPPPSGVCGLDYPFTVPRQGAGA